LTKQQILKLAGAFLAFAAIGCSAPPPAKSPSPKAQTATPVVVGTPTVALAPDSEFDKAKDQKGYEEVKKLGKSPLTDQLDAARKGQKVFAENCVICHGETGIGNGPGGEALDPKPRNFTHVKEYKFGNGELGIFRTAKYGSQGTGMVGFGDGRLTDEQIWQAAAFVRCLQKP